MNIERVKALQAYLLLDIIVVAMISRKLLTKTSAATNIFSVA